MPDYEFFCRRCQERFAAHMTMADHEQHAAECPRCHRNNEVERVISHFNIQTTRKSAAYR